MGASDHPWVRDCEKTPHSRRLLSSLSDQATLAWPRYFFTAFELWICLRQASLSEREADHCSGIMHGAWRTRLPECVPIQTAPSVSYTVMRGAAADRHPEQGDKTH